MCDFIRVRRGLNVCSFISGGLYYDDVIIKKNNIDDNNKYLG